MAQPLPECPFGILALLKQANLRVSVVALPRVVAGGARRLWWLRGYTITTIKHLSFAAVAVLATAYTVSSDQRLRLQARELFSCLRNLTRLVIFMIVIVMIVPVIVIAIKRTVEGARLLRLEAAQSDIFRGDFGGP